MSPSCPAAQTVQSPDAQTIRNYFFITDYVFLYAPIVLVVLRIDWHFFHLVVSDIMYVYVLAEAMIRSATYMQDRYGF